MYTLISFQNNVSFRCKTIIKVWPVGFKLPVTWLVIVCIIVTLLCSNQSMCASIHNTTTSKDILPEPTVSSRFRTSSGKICGDVHVEVLISSLVKHNVFDILAIYWEATTVLKGDRVELFNHDPFDNIEDPLFSAFVTNNTGHLLSNVTEHRRSTLPVTFEKYCLGYWAAYFRADSDDIAAYSCLSTEPRWMEQSWGAIRKLSIANTFLPGTHNSAAYYESYSAIDDTTVYRYTYNQEISILNQLLWGVRALDLRIAHYADSEKWWCNHSIMKIRPLIEVLKDIKIFLSNTKNEIVILDVHHFPVGFKVDGFEKHKKLVAFIEEEMKDYLVPASLGWASTLEMINATGKRAILAYNNNSVSTNYTWPPVRQKWGNVRDLPKLASYFTKVFQEQATSPWGAMVELTPNTADVILDLLGGLRKMADEVNPTVTSWFNGEWGRLCHIVHCDYIRGTGIVRAAIKWNLKRTGFRTCCFSCVSTASSHLST